MLLSGAISLNNSPYIQNLSGDLYYGKYNLTPETNPAINNFGQTWTQVTSAGSRGWQSVSLSATGQYQTAVVNGDYIYVSSDYGSTWTQKGTSQYWWSVSLSATGQYQTAVVYPGYIYISSDYGSTWTQKGTSQYWRSVSLSATGQYQTAVVYGGYIYVSSDYGSTWIQKGTSQNWFSVSLSATGQYQTAVVYPGYIYVSSDYGATWTQKGTSQNWHSVSLSATGQYQTAVAYGGYIYVSSDYGSTWTQKGTSQNWFSVSLSATGQYQTAVVWSGYIYVSSDYGSTWTQKGTSQGWHSVFLSSTGQYQTAVAYNDYLYTSVTQENTMLGTFNITGTPEASASSSLLRIGQNISGGNASGTYLGLNAASGFTGNLLDLQTNGSSVLSVSSTGALTANGINVASGNLSVVSGTTTLGGALTVTSGGASIAGGLVVSAGGASITGTVTLSGKAANQVAITDSSSNLSTTTGGTDGNCLVLTAGVPAWGTCIRTATTLQGAYDATSGSSILTTDARDLTVTLADTTTDSNFLVNIATGSTGRFAVQSNGTDVFAVTASGTTIQSGGLTVNAGGASISGAVTASTSLTTPLVQTASGNLNLQATTGIVALNQAAIQNYLQVYAANGTSYLQLTNDGTNSQISSSTGEVQIAGAGTNQFILGDTGQSVNLVFEESASIGGTNGGGKTITLGIGADTINLNTPTSTYNIGTLAAVNATLNTTSTSSTALVVNAPTSISANLIDLQVNGSSKLSVSSNGTMTGTAASLSATSGALMTTGAPSAGASIIQMASAIAGGSANGTYIGINPASFTGDFSNYQVNGASKFVVTSSGSVGIGVASSSINGTLDVRQAAVGQLGLYIKGIASATADLIRVEDSSGKILFAVDVTGHIVNGSSLPGVPIVGVDANSGSAPGDLAAATSPLRPTAGSGLTLNIAAGAVYTADSVTSAARIARCNLASATTLTMTDNATNYVYVTASGAASTTGITCAFNTQTTVPTFSASYPTVVLAKVITSGGVIQTITDTRFFTDSQLTYVKTAAAVTPGAAVIADTSADNQVTTTTSAATTGVEGVIVVGNTAPGTAIMMIDGTAFTMASATATRDVCAQTTATAGEITNSTAGGAFNTCLGIIKTAASTSYPSVMVRVQPR
jgi:hypothetical protein